VLADHLDRGRLRAFVAGLLAEADLHARLEVLEAPVAHAVAMKVDLAAVGRRNTPRAALSIDARDAPMRRHLVRLHVSAA
jgi:hypothetical protein